MNLHPVHVKPVYGIESEVARPRVRSGPIPGSDRQERARASAFIAMALVAAALPLVGLVSLLLRSQLDPHIENYPLHFVIFGVIGAVAFGLGYAAGEAAKRRGDARVLLLSLAFMATGGFLWLHAIGTRTSSSRRSMPAFRSQFRSGF